MDCSDCYFRMAPSPISCWSSIAERFLYRAARDHRSIRRKLKTYYDGWRAQRHLEQFAIKEMRVLTVTRSRLDSMAKRASSDGGPASGVAPTARRTSESHWCRLKMRCWINWAKVGIRPIAATSSVTRMRGWDREGRDLWTLFQKSGASSSGDTSGPRLGVPPDERPNSRQPRVDVISDSC
jgi:hypothetical protein